MITLENTPNDLRDRKRQLTLERIAEAGLKLFIENGYEATTLDAIAAASGISRRTFFHYMKSKEEVLLAHESGKFPQFLRPTFLMQSPDQSPLAAARKTLLALASMYETKESILADRILRSMEALRLRKEALLVQMEEVLAQAMYTLWPDPARQPALRLDAMVSMGALRVAKENWRREEAAFALTHYIDGAFDLLDRPSHASGRTHINPDGLHDPTASGYTHVVVAPLAGRTVYAAGQGVDHRGGGLSLDFAAQLDGALANMAIALQAGGAGVHDVVRITLLIVDHSEALLPIWSAAARRVWGDGPFPASTLIPVPRLALDGMRVEIEATAVVGGA